MYVYAHTYIEASLCFEGLQLDRRLFSCFLVVGFAWRFGVAADRALRVELRLSGVGTPGIALGLRVYRV